MPGTVSVACKLPHGLLLQLQVGRDITEQVLGGGTRETKRFERVGKIVRVKGYAVPVDRASDVQMQSGYAITSGVDADFFAAWLEQNADHPAVEGGFIFAHEKPQITEGQARERQKVKNGFEATDPENLPQEFRRRDSNISKASRN